MEVLRAAKKKLPKGWRWAFLGDVDLATIVMGQSPPGETYNKEKIGLPFFQGSADFGNIHPKPAFWCSAPLRIAEPNDILISVRAPVGPANIADVRSCIGRGITAIRCKEKLHYKYLHMILRNYEKKISSGGAGSIFNAIGKDEIKSIKFPLPPTLGEQISIANELEQMMVEVEKVRREAQRQRDAIAAMQDAILREVFPYKTGDKLPVGWRWTELKGISIKIQYGLSRASSFEKVGPKLLRITDIQNGDVSWDHVSYCPCNEQERINYSLDDEDILFTRTGATTGKSYLVTDPEDAVFASYLIRVQCDKAVVLPRYLYAFFQSPLYWQLINSGARGGTLAGFNASMLSRLSIPLPESIQEQHSLINGLDRKTKKVEIMQKAAQHQKEAIESLPSAILRGVFDFEEE